jgi:hypothetical protein
MKIKVKQTVKIDEEEFDKVLVEYLQQVIDTAEAEGSVHGPAPHLIKAMKLTHDWFAYPDEWYHTVEELEGETKKPAKIKAKTKK